MWQLVSTCLAGDPETDTQRLVHGGRPGPPIAVPWEDAENVEDLGSGENAGFALKTLTEDTQGALSGRRTGWGSAQTPRGEGADEKRCGVHGSPKAPLEGRRAELLAIVA